jgi:hypothetical protein
VGAAIEEEHLSETCPALALAAAVLPGPVAPFGRDVGGSEPAAKGFPVDLESVLLFQGLGKVVVVVLREHGPVQLQDLVTQTGRLGVCGPPAAVAVDDSFGTERRDSGLQPEDLAHAQSEHLGGRAGRQPRERPLNHAQSQQLVLLEQNL